MTAGSLTLAALATNAQAQEPSLRFSVVTPEDGLSQGSVWAITQDQQGFLWLGTENGLDRFDGVEVQRLDLSDSGLGIPFVRALLTDGDALWIGTDGGGLARFEPATGTFRALRHDPRDPQSLAEDEVVALDLDPRGHLWVATRTGGVQRLRQDGKTFDLPRELNGEDCPGLPGNLHALLADREGTVWVGTSEGLYRHRPGEGCPQRTFGAGSPSRRLSDPRLTHLRQADDGSLWAATLAGVDRLDPKSGIVLDRFLPGEFVTATVTTGDGTVWAGLSGGGLAMIKDGATHRYRHRLLDPTSLSGDTVRSLFEDRGGVLWVGTEQAGVNRLPASRWLFGAQRVARTEIADLPLRSVMALLGGADGSLWVGTRDHGLFRLPADDGLADHWGDKGNALDSARISALADGGAGAVLVATAEGSLYVLDRQGSPQGNPQGDSLRRFPPFTTRSIRAIRRQADGRLWVATWGDGLLEVSPEGSVLRRWRTTAQSEGSNANSLSDDIVLCLEITDDGAVWAGTWSGGLNRIDPSTGRVQHFRRGESEGLGEEKSEGEERSLASDRIASLLAHGDTLWVGTDRGLQAVDLESGRVSGPPLYEGTTIYALAADSQDHLWFSSDRSLHHFDPTSTAEPSLRDEHFLARHGLQGSEFNVGAFAYAGPRENRRVELAFGGISGINRFRPHPLHEAKSGAATQPSGRAFRSTAPPPLVLTELRVGERTLPIADVLRGDSPPGVQLAAHERTLHFTASLLDFADPEAHRFAYRLVGRDDHWIELGRQRSGALFDLAPGNYVLEVTGTDTTNWQANGEPEAVSPRLSLPLTVLPTFWQRREVRGAAVLTGLALIALVLGAAHRWRLNRLLRSSEEALEVRQRLLEAREQERVVLARDLHDGPLQRIHALQLAIGQSAVRGAEGWRGELTEMVQEVRRLCTRLRSPVLEVFGLPAALRDLVEELGDGVAPPRIDLHLEEALPEIELPSSVALYRVAREALCNALRHGEAQNIRLSLRQGGDGEIVLAVSDDGAGFIPPSRWLELARQGHLGILGMAERMESVGGSLSLDSAPGSGTRVRAHLSPQEHG